MSDSTAVSAGPPIWTGTWFWVVLAGLSTAPFWFAPIPPLADFPGHVGRYHIMLDIWRSPSLQRFYSFRWALIGNLGADLLMTVLGPLLGAERGAWLIAAATPALLVLGIFAVSRAIHGRVQATAFLALPFVYARGFELGFLNFDLAVALALLVFALWVALAARPRLRAGAFVFIGFGLWVCHSLGWGLLGLLVGGYELRAAVAERGWRPAAAWQTAMRLWPLAPPALLIATVAVRGPTPAIIAAGAPHSPVAWVLGKLSLVIVLLYDRAPLFDVASVLLILISLYASLRWLHGRVSPALAVPAALVGLAIVAMPSVAAGIAAADLRLAPIAIILFVLALNVPAVRWTSLLIAFGLALTGLRLAVTAVGWHADSSAYERSLSALKTVPIGARILVLVPVPEDSSSYSARPMSHLADLAIVRRDAFVNTQWEIAGAQLLRVKANADTPYHADPSQFVATDKVDQALAAAPLDHFDDVWVLGRYPSARPPAHLVQVYADDETRLFRVDR